MHDERPSAPRRSFTEEIADLDKDILRLLLRRHNVLQKLRAAKGMTKSRAPLDPKSEQELRAAWERNAARISRDPLVGRQLFSLIQELSFLPKPVPGEEERPPFGLAPARRPVNLRLPGSKACRRVRLYLALAAGSGQGLRIRHTLLNDPLIECVKAFNQAGARLTREEEEDAVLARPGLPLTLPDAVIFVGDDALNFHLLLGHYLLRPSHAKFTGDVGLKLCDLSALRRFTPDLGARLTNVVPKSDGLPVRVEASGLLPEEAAIPADLPDDAVTGLLMAAACGPHPLTFDLSAHARADALLEEALDVLRACKVEATLTGQRVRIAPGVSLPDAPRIGMDLLLAGNLLALPAFAGGRVELTGIWPDCAPARRLEQLLKDAGLTVARTAEGICAQGPDTPEAPALPDCADLLPRFAPLALALAVLPALLGRECALPALPPAPEHFDYADFTEALGLRSEHGKLLPPERGVAKSAPPRPASTPAEVLALALCAFARPRLTLADPGVITALWPQFWALYNSLPDPEAARAARAAQQAENNHDAPRRKRLRVDHYAPATGTTPDGTER